MNGYKWNTNSTIMSYITTRGLLLIDSRDDGFDHISEIVRIIGPIVHDIILLNKPRRYITILK